MERGFRSYGTRLYFCNILEQRKASFYQVFVKTPLHLVETEVEGVSKGSGLQGYEPAKDVDDDPQEEDADVGGQQEGQDEVTQGV